jgi:hypothetical protein
MGYKWAVYNQYGGLITKTLTRAYAVRIANKYVGAVVKAISGK